MAKRVNKPFVIGITVVVGGAAVAAYGMVRLLHHHNADWYIARAEKETASGQFPEAAADYGNAIARDRGNKDLYIRLGDVFDRMVIENPTYLGKSREMWQAVLQMDPLYQPASQRLLESYVEQMRSGITDPETITQLRRAAELAAKADPNNATARSYVHIAPLQQWLSGAGIPAKVVDEHLSALEGVLKKDPADADAALVISTSQMKRAREATNNQHPEQAAALYDQIAARHEGLVKALPNDPAVQLRAYQVFLTLGELDSRAEQKDRYPTLRDQAIAAAESSAKPPDPMFDDTQRAYADWLARSGKSRAEVEKVYRAWSAAKPASLRTRVELAEFLGLDPAQRPEAEKLLSTPIAHDPSLHGWTAIRARVVERAGLIDLNSYRLEDARANPKEADSLLGAVEKDLIHIAAIGGGEDYPYLKLRGKTEMLRHKTIDAVKTFEKARTLLAGRFDTDLLINLGQAYIVTGQTGSAQQVMENMVQRLPNYVPARVMLAEFYLDRHMTEQAAVQIDKLSELATNDPRLQPDVARLRVALVSLQNPEGVKQELSKLPEATRGDRLGKAAMAAASGDNAESRRLLGLVLSQDPADPDAVRETVNLAIRDLHPEEARQVVAAALQAKPDDRLFQALRDRLNATTPEALRKWQDEMADQITDPFTRALRKAQLAMSRGQYDEAGKRLDEADKIKGDDPRSVETRLQWYEQRGRLADAAPFIDHAARAGLDGAGGLMFRTRYALATHDAANALKYGNDLVGQYGSFAQSWLLLGKAQQLAGQYADAVRSFDFALARQSTNVEAMQSKIVCLDSLGQFDREKDEIAKATSTVPESIGLRDLSLNYELRHGDPEKVVQSCEELLKKEPENPAVYAALGQACNQTAQSKYGGDPEQAKQLLNRAREVLATGMTKFADKPQVTIFYSPLAATLQSLGQGSTGEGLLKEYAARPDQKNRPDACRELATFYERAKQQPAAEQAWREALARSGNAPEQQLDLANFFVRSHRSDDALKALEANGSDPRIIHQRIEVLLTANRLAEARKLVEQAMAANPADTSARYYRGVIELQQGDAAGAEKDFTALRDQDPQSANLRLWLARAMRSGGNLEGAIGELEVGLKAAPLRSDIRLALLDACSAGPKPRWEEFDRMIQDAMAVPSLSTDPVWLQVSARGWARRHQFERALADIDGARKLDPTSYVLRQDQVNFLVEARKYRAVLDETDKELAEGHKEGLIYEQRGVARGGLGDKPGALKEFDKALEIAMSAKDAAGAADVLRSMRPAVGIDDVLARLDKVPPGVTRDILEIELYGQKSDATAELRAAQAMLAQGDKLTRSQRIIAIRSAAESYYALKQPENAREMYDQLLKLQPDDIVLLNNLAYLTAEDLHQPKDAKFYSSRAFDLAQRTGGNAEVADTHGWVLTLCGDRDAQMGLIILERLVDSNATLLKARYHLGRAYMLQQHPQQARLQLVMVQQKIDELLKNHQPVDDELKNGVQQAMRELAAKGQASSQ